MLDLGCVPTAPYTIRYMMKCFVLTLLVVCLPEMALAQYTKDYSPWPVTIGGDTLQLPFWGGVNSPKPSLVDFDDDGLIDLMIGETRGKVSYLRNTGTASNPIWTPIVERIGGVDTRTWHRFCDIDGDGDLDLFCDAGNLMTAYYRNESVGASIVFTLIKDNFGGFETGVNNTGDFADLDDDGDFDFFLGSVTGELAWYCDITGDVVCQLGFRIDTIDIDPLVTDTIPDTTCFYPCPDASTPDTLYTYNLATVTCPYYLVDPFYDSVFAFPGGLAAGAQQPQHGFSTITFADHDADGDGDLFWGDINNNNAYLFANLGTPSVSDLTEITESYFPIATFGLNHTAFADLDNDNDIDAIVGAANGDDINNLMLLRNSGSVSLPSYTLEVSNIIKGIDVSSYAIPALGDLDGDGDIDLLIGRGDGRLSHFENNGSETTPSMSLTSDFYKSIDVGLSAAPSLIDWDNDGDLDLLIGNEAGRIEYWRNDGSPNNFAPVQVAIQLGGILVDILAVPCPVDWDGDGLTDLLVGEWDFNGFANVLLYENSGSIGAPTLSLVTNRLLKRIPRDFTLPVVYDWDCDGKRDLILGGRVFGSTLFRNMAPSGTFPDSLTLLEQPDSLPWRDDGYRLSAAFADIDGDLLWDVFVGEEDGGVNFYRRDASSCSCPTHGDPNADGIQNISDVVATVNIVFRGGEGDLDSECCPHMDRADHNCDCVLNVQDVVAIVNTAFRGGPSSCNPCALGNQCPK